MMILHLKMLIHFIAIKFCVILLLGELLEVAQMRFVFIVEIIYVSIIGVVVFHNAGYLIKF